MPETFHIVPATTKWLSWILVPVVVLTVAVLVGVAVLLGFVLYSARHATFELSAEGLRLRGEPLYRRFVPAAVLRGDEAAVVDLNEKRELLPRRRTFGTGIGGYGAGWFRLNSGQKALVYLTDRSRVVVVPTTEDFVVMLSVTEPEKMARRMRELYGGSG